MDRGISSDWQLGLRRHFLDHASYLLGADMQVSIERFLHGEDIPVFDFLDDHQDITGRLFDITNLLEKECRVQ